MINSWEVKVKTTIKTHKSKLCLGFSLQKGVDCSFFEKIEEQGNQVCFRFFLTAHTLFWHDGDWLKVESVSIRLRQTAEMPT